MKRSDRFVIIALMVFVLIVIGAVTYNSANSQTKPKKQEASTDTLVAKSDLIKMLKDAMDATRKQATDQLNRQAGMLNAYESVQQDSISVPKALFGGR